MPPSTAKPPTAPSGVRRVGRRRAFTPIPSQPPAPALITPPASTSSGSTSPPCCDAPKYEWHDGSKVCVECGTVLSEANIVAEVTFGETATGAATVQGGFVGEGARHAKTLGAAASRRIGGGGSGDVGGDGAGRGRYASREETEANGRAELRALCPQLRIPANIEDVAFNLWKLAASHNFIQGRRTGEVAGVCLYAACRRDRHNTILLMDISEALAVNVFKLGDTYKELSKELYLEVHSHLQPVVEIEPLLMRYCSKLEFGDKTKQVAEDAAKIVRRMKRDWMVTGRHPAGLCGACIILAARMNNFRRTVREIVYVVRVSDMTIVSRLAEFKRTRSSTLSVQDFRKKGLKLKFAHDPPAMNAAAERQRRLEEKKKRRDARQSLRTSAETDAASISSRASSAAADDSVAAGNVKDGQDHSGLSILAEAAAGQTVTPPATQSQTNADGTAGETRRDADGFVIPALPSSQGGTVDDKENTSPRKRGRPKAPTTPVIELTEDDFAREDELEHDIENLLQDPNCVSARNDTEREKLEARSAALAAEQRALDTAAAAARLASEGRGASTVSDSVEIDPSEFADDPEVQNALLDEDAVRIKETIWLRDNEDWLRAQQAKHLKERLEEAEGRRAGADGRAGAGRKGAGGVAAAAGGGPGGQRVGKRKRSRMGDGSVLREKGTPVESPADAAQRMLDKHAGKTFSRAVDYAALNRIFGGDVGPGKHEVKRLKKKEAKLRRSASVSSAGSAAVGSSSTAREFTFVHEGPDQGGNVESPPPAKKRRGSATPSASPSKDALAATSIVEPPSAALEGAVDAPIQSTVDVRRGSQESPLEIEDKGGDDEEEVEEEDEEDDEMSDDADDAVAGGYHDDDDDDDGNAWAPHSSRADTYDDEDDEFERAKGDITGDFGTV